MQNEKKKNKKKLKKAKRKERRKGGSNIRKTEREKEIRKEEGRKII